MYPYQMKLDSIDRLRVDGKFPVGDDIPEGQSAVNLLLRDCQNTILELRTRFDGQQPIETTDGIKT